MCVAGSIPMEPERQALPGGRGRALTSATWLRPCQRSGPAGSGPHPRGPHGSSKAGVPPTPGLIFPIPLVCAHRYSVRSVLGEEVSPFLPQTAPLSATDICHFQLPLWPDWPRLLKTPSLSRYIQLQTNSLASESYSQAAFQINSHYNRCYQESQ